MIWQDRNLVGRWAEQAPERRSLRNCSRKGFSGSIAPPIFPQTRETKEATKRTERSAHIVRREKSKSGARAPTKDRKKRSGGEERWREASSLSFRLCKAWDWRDSSSIRWILPERRRSASLSVASAISRFEILFPRMWGVLSSTGGKFIIRR